MATKRRRGAGSWEYTVRRAGLLPKPLYFTFDREDEGDSYVAKLEAMLKKGVVPAELLTKPSARTVGDLVAAYRERVVVRPSTRPYLDIAVKRWGATYLAELNYEWAEKQVDKMKEERLTPVYIRRLFRSSLGAALTWGVIKQYSEALTANPVALLPRGFARYEGNEVVNEHRERRLENGEDEKIRPLLSGERLLIYTLALETAMRLSEIYSLTKDQVNLAKRTVFLDKTKNGDSRQVPLSSVALAALQGFEGFSFGPKCQQTSGVLSKYFIRKFVEAGCADLHFHDLRHEATCRLFERTKLSDARIAKITGHRDPRMLLRYANLRGTDLAEALW